MPAPVIQSVVVSTQSTSPTITAAAPPSLADGDLMVAILATINVDNVDETHAGPSGWTEIITENPNLKQRGTVYSKIAASEAGSYAFSANQTLDLIAGIFRITGHRASGYIHQAAMDPFINTGTFVCPSVDTTVNDCLIIYGVQWTGTSAGGGPAGTTLQISQLFAGETSQRVYSHSKTLALAGPTGTGIYTVSGSRSGWAMTLAVAPPGPSGNPWNYNAQVAA